ncbi:MAG: DMT family transporter [Theionarchaea archaeon]|nr:DMT family transporter [Theionarchaea archaeon]
MRFMNRGYILAAGAGVAWGTIPLAVKQIYSIGSASPLEISFFRFLIAFVIIVFVTKMKKEPLILVSKSSVLMGFWGIFWMSLISFYGMQYTTAVNATILFNSNPLFVAVMATVLKWEKFTRSAVIGILLGITGVVLVSGFTMDIHLWGDVLVLAGAFGWAVYTLLSYTMRGSSSLSVTTSSLFWGLLWFTPFMWRISGDSTVTGEAWLWILYIAIIPTAAAFVCYVKAVDTIGSTRASVFQYLAPAVAVILSFGFGLEKVSLYHIIGIIFIVLGIELTRRTKIL